MKMTMMTSPLKNFLRKVRARRARAGFTGSTGQNIYNVCLTSSYPP